MGLLDIFKKKSKQKEDNTENKINSFIVDMCDSVCEKCDDGDSMEKLNEFERVFYITQLLEMEVNNGGFSQFFYNSSGNFSNELVQAFTKIGAYKTAEICKNALDTFGTELPINKKQREEMLDALESDEIDDILEECDNTFLEYEENLNKLNYEYIINHRDHFD